MSGAVYTHFGPLAIHRGPGRFQPRAVYAAAEAIGNAVAGSARVLVVEDDHLVSMEVENTLIDAGFLVVGIAVSADEAVAMARGERPDIVVMDIRLVGRRDGIDAAIDIFRETGIRCIFATAHSDAHTRQKAQAAQPLGWLSKPYAPGALAQAIRDALPRPRE